MSSVLELTIAEDWQAVLDALQTNPQGASDRDDWERLPLHYAILTKAPLQVVSALLNAFPEGVKCKDDMYEDTPLDLAEKSDAEPEVVAALAAAAKGVANSSWQPFNLTRPSVLHTKALSQILDVSERSWSSRRGPGCRRTRRAPRRTSCLRNCRSWTWR